MCNARVAKGSEHAQGNGDTSANFTGKNSFWLAIIAIMSPDKPLIRSFVAANEELARRIIIFVTFPAYLLMTSWLYVSFRQTLSIFLKITENQR